MKRLLVLLLMIFSLSISQTIEEMKFEGVKLDTVVKALAKVVKKNVIIDPNIKDLLKTDVNIYIQKPLSVNEAFNLILKEYGLIAVPVNDNIYKITRAGELEINIGELDESDIEKIIELLKRRVSASAEIVIDKTLKTLYVRDSEKNIKKLEKTLKKYVDKLLAEKAIGIEERPEAVVTKVFYLKTINIDDAEQLLAPHISKETLITKAPTFNALVITDTTERIKKYEEVLKEFLVTSPAARKPVTEIFYLRYISPAEFIKMIEPIRSEAGLVLTGGAVKVETAQGQSQQAQPKAKITPILKEFHAVMVTD